VEGTVLLSPVSFGDPPADDARTTPQTPAHVDAEAVPKGIGARLGPSARLIDESIDDLRALDH
jgi:predicted N-acetyltransferase YhbS